ncbi:DNA mismatch repair endonuclease MutL [Notoacmeibacter ruber]|uniref:DNA mismatch repair protein MutL n=1 Tax=Notoacmeibacter ruber TaxID=2670375 RepID=A0A3L7J9B7_9HYPH|nr:DNA mismatch repair endonuclease MutL [Notoacmeibacter ruber]RLQ87283.1 DNA mismatch repair endonuclease MutL [Notoacmeibacter ruber]
MTIRQLPETIVNRIAAGEVVERPASVVKELVENAIDAGATRIEIATAGGGLSLLRVSDNGSGIEPGQLPLAVARHCTSKLSDNIFDIRSLGFRGEALPSIGSVARLSIRSATEAGEGAEITVEGGELSAVRPAACNRGTVVEVRDLFFSTPARLKFMKSERAESAAITDQLRRIALAFPGVRFALTGPDRSSLELPLCEGTPEKAATERMRALLGHGFAENSLPINAMRDGVRLTGRISVPSYSRGNAQHQFVMVNGRPVRDKRLAGAIRGAYADALPRDRHAAVVLFLDLDPALVDVNVHPQKADVRFRDSGMISGLIVGAIRQALSEAGIRPSTDAASAMAAAFRPAEDVRPSAYQARGLTASPHSTESGFSFSPSAQSYAPEGFVSPSTQQATPTGFSEHPSNGWSSENREPPGPASPPQTDYPLGAPRAQIHENYIVAQTADSLILVDQHAAHERLVYEKLKTAMEGRALPAQHLLIPEVVDLPMDDVNRLEAVAQDLARFGLIVERFGPGAVAIQATPAMLGEIDAGALIRDLADELAENENSEELRLRLNHVAATMACHGSVRSGRRLRVEEMEALLRQMEQTPGSGTCNHGRPTYIELKLDDIEKLFGRR